MAREVEQTLRRSLLFVAASYEETCWRPAADVYRTADGWLVKFELAGVALEDIEITFCGQHLTVQGERRDRTIGDCRQSYSMEICYSRFLRTVELPEPLLAAAIAAEHRDGMLIVRLMESP